MDSAFKSRPFAGYTTEQLRQYCIGVGRESDNRNAMIAEVARREKVTAGDVSVMTPSERLRAK